MIHYTIHACNVIGDGMMKVLRTLVFIVKNSCEVFSGVLFLWNVKTYDNAVGLTRRHNHADNWYRSMGGN